MEEFREQNDIFELMNKYRRDAEKKATDELINEMKNFMTEEKKDQLHKRYQYLQSELIQVIALAWNSPKTIENFESHLEYLKVIARDYSYKNEPGNIYIGDSNGNA